MLVITTSPGPAADLAQTFRTPPESSKPAVYWYWMFGNINTNSISQELDLMRKLGIGQAFMADIWTRQNDAEPGNVNALSPEWWNAVTHAVREGGRAGVKVGLFNSPGWSQSGGPWVKPEQAMRYLAWTESVLEGPQRFNGPLPAPAGTPPAPAGPIQDFAVLAFPLPPVEAVTAWQQRPKIGATPAVPGVERLFDGQTNQTVQLAAGKPGEPQMIELTFTETFTARSLVLHLADYSAVTGKVEVINASGEWEALRDFSAESEWAALTRVDTANLRGPVQGRPKVISLGQVSGRQFRLTLEGLQGERRFTEIELLGAPRIEFAVQKQLACLKDTGGLPKWDAYRWPAAKEVDSPTLVTSPSAVVDLTRRLSADGTLDWDVPPGRWVVQRFALAPTGTQNMPSAPSARGFEVDKMNRRHVRAHFDAYVGELLRRLNREDRKHLGYVVADSYEVGPLNWTDDFADAFRELRGYDPRPWLPVFSGRVVGSVAQSERFLWDLRRTVADRIASEYVGGLREACHDAGLKLWLENYGHWGFPAEFLQYGGQTDGIGGELWVGRFNEYEARCASSAGATYGKPVVSAETFTGGPSFTSTPRSLKTLGDFAFSQGINHLVLHVFFHQPWDDRRPGINAWFGTEFTRHNSWMPLAESWVTYLRRCSAVLQQGWRVADVAYFIGEDTPVMTGPQSPALPVGYDYDYLNADVLVKDLRVRDGRLVLPHGVSYRVLVLPPSETMRPRTLRKIRDLVRDGGIILGAPPERSPSLQDYPRCDAEVAQLAADLWRGSDNRSNGTKVGRGRIFRGTGLEQVFQTLRIGPDVADCPLRWTHRRDDSTDIYFLASTNDVPVDCRPAFRVTGKAPELWDPVTGSITAASGWSAGDAQTRVPLRLAPRGSIFVVFRHAKSTPAPAAPSAVPTLVRTVEGPWEVSFSSGFGAPASTRFDQLLLWNERPEPPIRHFSGIATYRARFTAPDTRAGRVRLNLGRVESLAEVRVNGQVLGTLWTEPYEIDITAAVKPGENSLELHVVNTWANTLIGAAKYPDGLPGTVTPYVKPWTSRIPGYKPTSPLQPSGLAGPVTVSWSEAGATR